MLVFTSHGAPIGAHAWSYKQQIFLALVGCLPICQVIYQKRVRGLLNSQVIFGVGVTGADPGFFLGGGALVSCSTSPPAPPAPPAPSP